MDGGGDDFLSGKELASRARARKAAARADAKARKALYKWAASQHVPEAERASRQDVDFGRAAGKAVRRAEIATSPIRLRSYAEYRMGSSAVYRRSVTEATARILKSCKSTQCKTVAMSL